MPTLPMQHGLCRKQENRKQKLEKVPPLFLIQVTVLLDLDAEELTVSA
jgi:hypothetical protein